MSKKEEQKEYKTDKENQRKSVLQIETYLKKTCELNKNEQNVS